MKIRPIVSAAAAGCVIGFVLASHASAANLVLNGSFEDTTAGSSSYNLTNADFNALMNNATAFGGGFDIAGQGELDIESNPGTYAPDSGFGRWHVSLVQYDALSLNLSESLVAGQEYQLTFVALSNTNFTAGTGPLRFGTSSSATDFGSLAFSTGAFSTVSQWQSFSTSFVASSNSDFLTIQGSQGEGGANSWMFVDGVSLQLVPTPGSLALLGLGGLCLARRRR